MSIQLTPISVKYFSEIKNGPLFDQNTGDYGTHLKGNLGERIKAEIDVQISWRFDIVKYDITNNNTITLSSGSFFAEGFSIGDSANITFRGAGGTSHTFNVISISSDGKQMVTDATLTNGAFGVSTYDTLRGLTPLEGLKYDFNFIGDNDTTNFISAIDDTSLSYKTDGIRTAFPTPVVSTWNDTIKGSQTGNHQVSFIQDTSDNGIIDEAGAVVFPLASIQEFKIEHEFIITPYYLDGELSNLENLLRPERIEAGVSLKHVMDFEFRKTLSNPNTAKKGRYDNNLGKTSYFDENFGDETTQYSIDSVVLTRGVDVVTGIDAGDTTNVSFSVLNSDGVTNPFLTTQPAVAYVSLLPELDAYNSSTSVFTDNFIYESFRGLIDAAPSSGTIINNLDIDLISTTQIDVSFDIIYSAGQQSLIDEGDNYLIAFGVGDDALTTDLSNKSILKVNLSEYIKDTAVPGLMDNTKFDFFTHVMPYTTGLEVGFTGLEAWVQDGIMINWGFTLDRTLDAVLERFRIRLVALKVADDTFFPLEDVEYNLSGQVVTPGTPTIQNIEIDESRGFPLADGSMFNYKKFTTGAYSAPDQAYEGQTGFKINWQEWLSLPDADTIFYDPSEPNNGLNQKASQYSLKDGYEIRFLMDADVSVDGATITKYVFKSPEATIRDFEEQDGSPITWTPIKETFDLDGANLNQEILTNQKTRVQITFTPDATPGLASLYWGIGRIEEANQPGVAVCELSSLNYRPSKNNNILTPLDGQTEASLTLDSGNLVLEFLVDNDQLNPAKSYNVYGRLGLVDQTVFVPPIIYRDISIDFDNNANFVVFQQTEAMAAATLTDGLFQLLDASGDIDWKSDVANLGGDRSDWAAATSYADFAALAVALAANSNLFIYCEVNETNYPIILKEGLIINYEAIGTAVTPTSFTFNFDADKIDLDQIRWFNQKVDIAWQSQGTRVSKVHYALRVAATLGGEYTEYLGEDATGLTALNAAILLLADDVKYGMHIYLESDATAAGSLDVTYDIDFLQVGSDDFEVSQQVGLNTVNDQRPFTDNAISLIPEAVGFFGDANVSGLDLGTGRNTLFDIQNDNSFTIDIWLEYTQFGTGASPTLLYSRGGYGGASSFPINNGIQYSIGSFGISFVFAHTQSIRTYRVAPYDWQRDHIYHVVVTYEPVKSGGFYQGSGFNYYINGYKIDTVGSLKNDIPTDGTSLSDTIEPTTTTQGSNYEKPLTYQCGPIDTGALGSPDIINQQGRDTLKSTHRIRIWDVKLTDEEVYQLFKQGKMINANLPQSANILDNFDFANPDLIGYTIPNSGTGVDGQLVKGDLGTNWSTIVADNGILNWD